MIGLTFRTNSYVKNGGNNAGNWNGGRGERRDRKGKEASKYTRDEDIVGDRQEDPDETSKREHCPLGKRCKQ